MRRIIPVLSFVLLLFSNTAFSKQAEPKEYLTCKLADMGMEIFSAGGIGSANAFGNSAIATSRNLLNKNYGFKVSCDGLSYYSYYIPRWRWSKSPDSEWIVGDPIEFREKGKNVFLKKSDGKELKTELIKKVRE